MTCTYYFRMHVLLHLFIFLNKMEIASYLCSWKNVIAVFGKVAWVLCDVSQPAASASRIYKCLFHFTKKKLLINFTAQYIHVCKWNKFHFLSAKDKQFPGIWVAGVVSLVQILNCTPDVFRCWFEIDRWRRGQGYYTVWSGTSRQVCTRSRCLTDVQRCSHVAVVCLCVVCVSLCVSREQTLYLD